ncbi:hypothetical protein [Psychrobacter sp. I-STPA10]|uniref:hypothetical protein n=1 Tax=Psychrobacter sp. I-STPA10 TaxID=2585769 RepID=UPI001E56ABDA|nr:hypothetical protein [Psychrobacter sp. I-STPA10]
MKKFWFFFYGLPNIFGLIGLLIGLITQLILMLSSTLGGLLYWLPICLLLYALGWLLGWWIQDNDANLHFAQTQTAEQIEHELQQLLAHIKPRIPPQAYEHVKNIQTSVLSVLPHLVAGQFADQNLYTVKQAVFDYLPTTLENYLRLPTVYANMHPVNQGKTAKTLLIEQLATLDDALLKVTHNIFAHDVQALLANQRFLQTRLNDG